MFILMPNSELTRLFRPCPETDPPSLTTHRIRGLQCRGVHPPAGFEMWSVIYDLHCAAESLRSRVTNVAYMTSVQRHEMIITGQELEKRVPKPPQRAIWQPNQLQIKMHHGSLSISLIVFISTKNPSVVGPVMNSILWRAELQNWDRYLWQQRSCSAVEARSKRAKGQQWW